MWGQDFILPPAFGPASLGPTSGAGAKNAQSRAESKPWRTGEEKRLRPVGVNRHDGCAGALQVTAVVEIGNKYVTGLERTSMREALRDEGDAVRIHVAIFWNGVGNEWRRHGHIGKNGLSMLIVSDQRGRK